MTIRYMLPEEIERPLPVSIGLSGPSGCGKTYSALRLARGLARTLHGDKARIAFVDTENRRGLHYRAAFPEIISTYVDFSPEDDGRMVGYPPERWVDLLDMVEGGEIGALVIDSFSHAWEGINGVLDLQAQELDRLAGGDERKAERVGQLAWAAIKPRYRRLINRIIRADVPIILCSRAKPVMQKFAGGKTVNARATKTRREDVPWDVAADADLIFEMAVMTILDPAHPGIPKYQIKVADQLKPIFRDDRPITEEHGVQMARWSVSQKEAQEAKAVMDEGRARARQGREAMRAYWQTLGAPQQATLRAILGELQELADQADAAAQAVNDDPFGAPRQEITVPAETGREAIAETAQPAIQARAGAAAPTEQHQNQGAAASNALTSAQERARAAVAAKRAERAGEVSAQEAADAAAPATPEDDDAMAKYRGWADRIRVDIDDLGGGALTDWQAEMAELDANAPDLARELRDYAAA